MQANHINTAKSLIAKHISQNCNISFCENSFFANNFPFFCISEIRFGKFSNINQTSHQCHLSISIMSKSENSDEITNIAYKIQELLLNTQNLGYKESIQSAFVYLINCNEVQISEIKDINVWNAKIDISFEVKLRAEQVNS